MFVYSVASSTSFLYKKKVRQVKGPQNVYVQFSECTRGRLVSYETPKLFSNFLVLFSCPNFGMSNRTNLSLNQIGENGDLKQVLLYHSNSNNKLDLFKYKGHYIVYDLDVVGIFDAFMTDCLQIWFKFTLYREAKQGKEFCNFYLIQRWWSLNPRWQLQLPAIFRSNDLIGYNF